MGVLLNFNSYAQQLNIDSCLQVLRTAPDDTNKVILLDRIAWNISYRNLQTGILYSDTCFALAKKLNYERAYSNIFNTQGAIYDDMAEVGKALNLYLDGLRYAKKYNQLKNQAVLYNSLGNLYSKRKDKKEAKRYYLLSVDVCKKIDFSASVAQTNLASLYMGFNMLDSAMYYLNLSMDYNIKHKKVSRLINNYILLSELSYEKKDKEGALNSANEAIRLCLTINDVYTLAHAYLDQSNAYYLAGDMKKAIKSLEDATATAKKSGDIPTLETSALYTSQIYEEIKDFENSLKFFKDYKMYKDSSLNVESISQIKNAEAKYESEKKQKEIELLGEKQKLNEAQNQKKKIYLIVAIIGIVVLVFVSVILYRNNILKQKTNKDLEAFNKEVNHQKELVEVKNKEITDSINYAKRIQQSILTSHNYFKQNTNDFFILFKPKDIVSGDFYWALKNENKLLVMTADCTGHGVPGAMMSMMGINYLNEIVNEAGVMSPAEILNVLRSDIIKTLNPEGSLVETKDGMDCCLCSYDFENMKLTYSCANNNFYLIRGKEIISSQSNKMPVGAGHNANVPFEEFSMDIEKGDLIISFTDGYADQFGGIKGKKFKYKQLEELLVSSAHLPLNELKHKLNDSIETWRGNLEQVDDICVIGIKI